MDGKLAGTKGGQGSNRMRRSGMKRGEERRRSEQTVVGI